MRWDYGILFGFGYGLSRINAFLVNTSDISMLVSGLIAAAVVVPIVAFVSGTVGP